MDEAVSKQYEIKTAEAKVEDYTAVIAKETATILDADSTIGDMAKVVARNEQDLAAATEIRDKEHADFEASDAELAETVDMLGRAIGIIAKEMKKSSFAQVSKTAVKQLVSTLEVVARASVVSQVDQDKLNSFIQAAEDAEMKSQHSFEMLAQSIEGELAADKKELNAAKTTKAASSEVKATAEADLGMTEKMLAEAKTYLGDLSQDCQTKAADWEVSQKARAEELQALSDALKIIKEKTGGATSRAYDFFEVKAKSGSR